jgi:cell division protein FtsB
VTVQDKIALLKKLHGETTAGTWLNAYPNACKLSPMPDHVWTSDKELVAKDLYPRDAEFIAASHNHLPDVLAEVERLRSGYLADENGNEYVQVCILKEKIREQQAEIERLRAENAKLQAAADLNAKEKWWAMQERDKLATDALATLSKYTATAAEGYRVAPHMLASDIDRLGRDLFEANCRADRLREALERFAGDDCVCPRDRVWTCRYCNARAALAGGLSRGGTVPAGDANDRIEPLISNEFVVRRDRGDGGAG